MAAVATTRSAQATSADALTLEQLAARSDVVAIGTVVATEVFPTGPAGQPGIHTRVQLAVDEMVVGSPVSLVEFWVHGGRLGHQMRVIRGQARFAEGEEVAVFLFKAPDGTLWPQGLTFGKWAVLHDGDTTVLAPPTPAGANEGAGGGAGASLDRDSFVSHVREARRNP